MDGKRCNKLLAATDEYNLDFVSYLDTLLVELEESHELEISPETKVATPDADIHNQRQEQPILQEVDELQLVTGTNTGVTEKNERNADLRIPAWAEAPFQVLMFEVCGVTLGVPLISLVGILGWSKAPCQLPGQPVWQLGLLAYRVQNIAVVDTARLIMPERIDSGREAQSISGSHLLLIGKGDFGLVIDAISSTVMMEREYVRWRRGQGQRPWLAGIMIEQLSVLLDVDGLLGMIQAA